MLVCLFCFIFVFELAEHVIVFFLVYTTKSSIHSFRFQRIILMRLCSHVDRSRTKHMNKTEFMYFNSRTYLQMQRIWSGLAVFRMFILLHLSVSRPGLSLKNIHPFNILICVENVTYISIDFEYYEIMAVFAVCTCSLEYLQGSEFVLLLHALLFHICNLSAHF